MARTEWLRTFLAVYRSGSITEGARQRALSQPAASQQLAGLERSVGGPLFLRGAMGVEPTPRGRELYGEIADPLDRLETVMAGLDSGVVAVRPASIRFGSSAEYFASEALGRLAPLGRPVSARFGDDSELLRLLGQGELDVAVLSSSPARRNLASRPIGMKHFVLVAAPELLPPAVGSLGLLGAWLEGRPWVAYSHDLPITRRFWREALGRPFGGELRLVAPDLRAVVAAVAAGMGMSILPTFVCTEARRSGAIKEVHPVSEHIPAEPWFACARTDEIGQPRIAELLRALGRPPAEPHR